MTVHDFDRSLAFSHHHQDAYWWDVVYKQAFPTMVGMQDVRGDGWAQRAGIDRRILLGDASYVDIDEKVREKDYGDILLEVWSDFGRRKPGWITKPLAIDYLAYAIKPAATVYLLPFRLLQTTYTKNEAAWRDAVREGRRGYQVRDAQNRGYVTRNLALPIADLLTAMRGCMAFEWGVPGEPAKATVTRIGDFA